MVAGKLKGFYLLIFIFNFLSVFSQEKITPTHDQKMWVESFKIEEMDPTAIREGTKKIDQNGEVSALIKIETTQKGFQFDAGSLGVVAVEPQNTEHPAEIWLYLPRGVKNLIIQHPILGRIPFSYEKRLEEGKTYRMKLTTNEVNQLVTDYDNEKEFVFDIYPPDATLYINGIIIDKQQNGHYVQHLPFGNKHYRVVADNYHPEEGDIEINDNPNNTKKEIILKQAFGYLNIPGGNDLDGAEVFLDSKQLGRIPIKDFPIKSGNHQLLINQKLYKPYSVNIEVTDSGTVNLNPSLNPNYAYVDFLISDPEVTIYDNGELLQFLNNKLTTRLEEGRHTIEVKKPSHATTTKIIEVQTGIRQSVGLESPHPLYGYITLNSSPKGASVYLNDKFEGITPINNKRILIGNYKVTFELKGYKSEERNLIVEKDKSGELDVHLNGYCSSTLHTYPSNASVYINGRYSGTSPYRFDLFTGNYNISIQKDGYLDYSKNMDLSANTPDLNIKLRKNLIKKNSCYLQAGYNIVGLSGINVGLGGYIQNMNIEANYIQGLGKSETIYWNYTGHPEYPDMATYTPWGMDLKLGYGFSFAGRFRITPQVGIQMVKLKESDATEVIANGASAASIPIGARFEVLLINHLGISVMPQYKLNVSKSEAYKLLMDASKKIKGFSEGFGLNVSLNVFF
ncbi:MAG: PEGA domain-containing protein [Muribaculaceae bacterium]|nr:PEGA domain-containing protein [Muribaculaceae bacterium]